MVCPRYGVRIVVFMKYVLSEGELRQRLSLPLDAKIKFSMRRFEEFFDYYGVDATYVSFSGGLDSTVALHLGRKVNSSVRGLFINTWMEDPRIRSFVREHDNIEEIKPDMLLKDIVEQHGWCWPSKDVAEAIYYARQDKKWALNKLQGLDRHGNKSEYRQQYKKYLPVIDWDIKISPACCDKQKEEPVMKYEKKTGRHPIVGLRASESQRRKEAYLRTGCNSFDVRVELDEESGEYVKKKVVRPMCRPIAIWTKQDILQYCVDNDIKISAPYGKIYSIGQCIGQPSFWSNKPCGKLGCSGDQRTGCIFCPVGCHLDNFSKFKNVKKYNENLYDYCMEELGEKRLLEKVNQEFGGELYK